VHIVQLKIDNSIYSNVMFLLNNLSLKGLEIKEENQQVLSDRQKIKKLLNESSNIFSDIKDPLEWQKKQREEWDSDITRF